jgi:hypothetical protein
MAFALSGQNLAFVEDLHINESALETAEDLKKALVTIFTNLHLGR